jgi:hypothetical protein
VEHQVERPRLHGAAGNGERVLGDDFELGDRLLAGVRDLLDPDVDLFRLG